MVDVNRRKLKEAYGQKYTFDIALTTHYPLELPPDFGSMVTFYEMIKFGTIVLFTITN